MSIYDILGATAPPASPDDIVTAEALLGSSMPTQLRALVRRTDGGALEPDLVLTLPDGSTSASFDLIPVAEMNDWSDDGRSDVGWPWCLDGSGNVLLVDSSNVVHFWDHDTGEAVSLGTLLNALDAELAVVSAAPSSVFNTGGSALLAAINGGDYGDIATLAGSADSSTLNKALVLAARWAPVSVVETVLDAGADIDGRSEPGSDTALIAAASNGKLDVVAFLVDRGADTTATAGGMNARKAAYLGDRDEVVSYLDGL